MALYRNKNVPDWWMNYLPDERNPYQKCDTLTLEKGCLANYWHIHSSNKHPNYKGAEACNFVHEMVRERFGGAFLTECRYFSYGGRKGEKIYHEPEHLVYEDAYIGEDDKIHIRDARRYYEEVIRFVKRVLREISGNRMQSGCYSYPEDFFPYFTDAELEENKKRVLQRAQG